MSAKGKFKYDETKFRPGQRKAALGLAEREFLPKDERKTKQEIAADVDVAYKTLWTWETQDANFIAYKNYLASEMLDSNLPTVYAKLLDVIQDGNTKGIELFLKRIGDLDTKSEVTVNNGSDQESFEDRKAALLARLGEGDEEHEGEE